MHPGHERGGHEGGRGEGSQALLIEPPARAPLAGLANITFIAGQASRVACDRGGVAAPRNIREKILTSRSALEGERKQVTVLFADVKGSMDLTLGRALRRAAVARLRLERCGLRTRPGRCAAGKGEKSRADQQPSLSVLLAELDGHRSYLTRSRREPFDVPQVRP